MLPPLGIWRKMCDFVRDVRCSCNPCLSSVPPGAPTDVSVDKVNKNGARLSWKTPKSDGGTPVTGYIVEKQKEGSDEWVPVMESREPSAFIRMPEGEKAQFRIVAVNREGQGTPSRPTALVAAENKPTAPRIATMEDGLLGGPGSGVGGLQDVTIKVGFILYMPQEHPIQ